MIIRGFNASNLLKYKTLHLPDLPEQGLIGISGANESGKSAIVEALCLALYGRTFTTPAGRLDKLVRWGEPNAEISLRFETGGERYTVTRYIDADANHSASLKRGDDQDNLASGAEAVNAAIAKITGVDFSQYTDAFYLAQQEFQAPDPENRTVRKLLGTADLDAATEHLRLCNREDRHGLDKMRGEQDGLAAELTALKLNPDTLGDLLSQQRQCRDDVDAAQQDLKRTQTLKGQVIHGLGELAEGAEAASQLEAGSDDGQGFRTAWRRLRDGMFELQTGLAGKTPPTALMAVRHWVEDLSGHLKAFRELNDRTGAYEKRLRHRLGEEIEEDPETAADMAEETFAEAQARLTGEIADLTGRGRRNRLGFWFIALPGLAGSALWTLFSEAGARFPEIRDPIVARLPELTTPSQHLLGAVSAVLVLLSVWLFFRSLGIRGARIRKENAHSALDRQTTHAREEIERLERLAQADLQERTTLVAQLDDKALHRTVREFQENKGRILLDQKAWRDYLKPLTEAAETLDRERQALLHQANGLVEASENKLHDRENHLGELAQAVDDEHERRAQAERIRDRQAELTRQRITAEKRIPVRERALALIAGACRKIHTQFNAQMRDYLQHLMPSMTDGRYQYLKIDENFSIQLFSSDKNDFVDLEDISGGARRQLLLIVRLAVAQALVDAHGEPAQTLMLDEPFAFFDRLRTEQTLMALPGFSRQIGQVWVISQEFEKHAPFDLRIECKRGVDMLVLG